MQFSLNTILAAVPFLSTTALAGSGINESADFRGCFDKGEKWTDLGTTEQIYDALDSNACDVDTGAWEVGEVVSHSATSTEADTHLLFFPWLYVCFPLPRCFKLTVTS